MGALSFGCVQHPAAYRAAISHFSAAGWRCERLNGWVWGRGGNLCWWGIVEKCSSSTRWPGGAVCAAQSTTGVASYGGGAFRIPVLERGEDGKLFLREFSGPENVEKIESGSSAANQSRTAPKSDRAKESKTVTGKRVTAKPSSQVKVNLPTLDIRARRLASAKAAAKGAPLYSKAARRFYNEKFRAEPQRLSKVLAAAGVASRRACEEVIVAGRVAVNGKVCKVPQTPVDPLKDIIYVDGNSLPKKMPPKLYFALNKPKGYICSAGEGGTKPVLSLFDDYLKVWMQRNPGLAKPRMFTVGRLDVPTTGLLLVTNDGDFAQKVSHPSSGLTKEYVATVNEKVTRKQLDVIAFGTMVQGVPCVPREVELMDMAVGDEKQRLRIVVNEGRNHEVRHLVENSGLQVLALKRIRIGNLRLSRKLGIGKFDPLTEAQVASLIK